MATTINADGLRTDSVQVYSSTVYVRELMAGEFDEFDSAPKLVRNS